MHKYLFSAIPLVKRWFPNARFFFIGRYDINDDYFQEIQRQMRSLELETIIKFTGDVSHQQVPAILSKMDICVLPSLSEGLSNTLLESMNAEIPVVATAIGGNIEVVENGKTGLLVPPGDADALAEAMIKILSDAGLRREMGRQAGQLHAHD